MCYVLASANLDCLLTLPNPSCVSASANPDCMLTPISLDRALASANPDCLLTLTNPSCALALNDSDCALASANSLDDTSNPFETQQFEVSQVRCRKCIGCARLTHMEKIVLVSGLASVGKTSVLRFLVPECIEKGKRISYCKFDCLCSEDEKVFSGLDVPVVTGLSGDICPDHFLVSNLPELWSWAERNGSDFLFIESAGLCSRCSPATEKTVAVTVLDATGKLRSPEMMGPMSRQADALVVTKVDLVSQAEREIIAYHLRRVNDKAKLFFIDGREGYGSELLCDFICNAPAIESYENDVLRHSMPSGVCSYCVGERRVGSAFQLGVVGKVAGLG